PGCGAWSWPLQQRELLLNVGQLLGVGALVGREQVQPFEVLLVAERGRDPVLALVPVLVAAEARGGVEPDAHRRPVHGYPSSPASRSRSSAGGASGCGIAGAPWPVGWSTYSCGFFLGSSTDTFSGTCRSGES